MFSRKKKDAGVQESKRSDNNNETLPTSVSQTTEKQILPHDKIYRENATEIHLTLKQNSENLNCQDSANESNVSQKHREKNLPNEPSEVTVSAGEVDGIHSKNNLHTENSACDNDKDNFTEKLNDITQNDHCEKSNLSLQPAHNMNGYTKKLCNVDKENIQELESKSTNSLRLPSEGGLEESDLFGSNEPLQPAVTKPDSRSFNKPEVLQSNKNSQNNESSNYVGEKVINRPKTPETSGNTFFSLLKEKIRSSKKVGKRESSHNLNKPQIQNSTRTSNLELNSKIGQNMYPQQTCGNTSSTNKSIDGRPSEEKNGVQQNEVPLVNNTAQLEKLTAGNDDSDIYGNNTNHTSEENHTLTKSQEKGSESHSIEKENGMNMKRSVCDPISESSFAKNTPFQSNEESVCDNQLSSVKTDGTFKQLKNKLDEYEVVTPKDNLKATYHNLPKGKEEPLHNGFKNTPFGEKTSQYLKIVTPGSIVSVKKKINEQSIQNFDENSQTYDDIYISEQIKTVNNSPSSTSKVSITYKDQPRPHKLNNEISKVQEQGSNLNSKLQVEKESIIESQVDGKKEEYHKEASNQILHHEKSKQTTRLPQDFPQTDKFQVPCLRMASPAFEQNQLNGSSVSVPKGDVTKNICSVPKQKELLNENYDSSSNVTSKRIKTLTGKSYHATDIQSQQVLPFGQNNHSKNGDQPSTSSSSRQLYDQLESFTYGNEMSLSQPKKSVGLNHSNECFDDILSAFQTDLRESVDLLDQGEVDLLDLHVDVSKVHAMALRYHGKMVDLVEDVENALNYAYENIN